MSAAAWYEELKSGPGWSWFAGPRAPQLVVMLLLIALAIDCALILTRSLGRSALPPLAPMRAALPSSNVNPTVELATVVNAHLFGMAGEQSGGNAPQTTMPLVLAGVLADKDPAKGQAIIGESATSAKLIAVGATIAGGARLNSVYDDRVLIERNGRLETLMLPRTAPQGRPAGMPPSRMAPQASAARDSSAAVLAGLVRVQPVFNQGKLSGYRIFPGGSRGASTFTQLGLRAGDLITAVNGTPLDDAARAMEVMQTLSSSASATVTVSRNGQNQEVNLNLANLNTEADATPGENPPGATAPAGVEPPPPASIIPRKGPMTNLPSPATPASEGASAGNSAGNIER